MPAPASGVEAPPEDVTPKATSEAPSAEPPEGEAMGINAPMVGTFYRSPSPDAPPFVDVGSNVEKDTTLCIIEVMKVMNPIKAGRGGRVARIAVGDAETVEFGQLLMTIDPD